MKIGIAGIGLIGSSLARALRTYGACTDIAVYDNLAQHMTEAQELNLGTHYCASLQELAADCDVIFVCTPLSTIAATIKYTTLHMKPGAIITDVGSVKSSVIAEIGPMPDGISYVPGHPIAGTEFAGPASGTAEMFQGKPYILISDGETNSAATGTVAALIQKIGAKPEYMTAENHDTTYAFVSHLQHILAYSLMNCAVDLTEKLGFDPTIRAGSSFNGTTRVAATPTALWVQVFQGNRDRLLAVYKALLAEMTALVTDIESGDAAAISERLERGRAAKLAQLSSTTTA